MTADVAANNITRRKRLRNHILSQRTNGVIVVFLGVTVVVESQSTYMHRTVIIQPFDKHISDTTTTTFLSHCYWQQSAKAAASAKTMAGTRLLVQTLILVQLLCVVLVSLHVGFCRPKLQRRGSSNTNKEWPKLLVLTSDDDGFLQTDPEVLCPWHYLSGLFDSDDASTVETTAVPSPPLPEPKTLQFHLVVEDPSQLAHWAAILEQEWNIPSYLSDLETVDISAKMHVLAAHLPMNDLLTIDRDGHLSMETLQTLWNHILLESNVIIPGLGETEDAFHLIFYIPQQYPERQRRKASIVDDDADNNNETTAEEETEHMPPIPELLSYYLHTDRTTATTSSKHDEKLQIIIPTTQNVNGILGAHLEDWMVQSIMGNNHPTVDPATITAFWNLLQAQWKQQTMHLFQYLNTTTFIVGTAALDELVLLPSEDPSMSDVAGLQMSIAQWQRVYEALQRLLVLHTGARTIPIVSPLPRLEQHFPLEHYAAILMPLLFPLLVPFMISTLKEYRRWKEKKSKKKEEEGSNKEKVA